MLTKLTYQEAYGKIGEPLELSGNEELVTILSVDHLGDEINWRYVTKEVKNDRRVSSQRSKTSSVERS